MESKFLFYADGERRPRGEAATITDELGQSYVGWADGDGTAALYYSQLWQHDALSSPEGPWGTPELSAGLSNPLDTPW